MQLSAFQHALAQVETLEFQLPDGQFVPAHFHLTEVGHVTRNISIVAVHYDKKTN